MRGTRLGGALDVFGVAGEETRALGLRVRRVVLGVGAGWVGV